MPRVKRKSYETRRKQIKLKRMKIREEQIKKLEEYKIKNQIDGTEQSTQVDDEEELSELQLQSRIAAKHAEYVRNYRKNMSEEKKRAVRAVAAQRMAQRRKNMSEEEKLAQREYHRQRMAFKRKNMSEEEKKVFRETQRWRMALKRQRMSEEQKLAAREADRRRVALKRKKWKEDSEHFHAAVLRLALKRQNFLPPSVDLACSTSDDDAPEDIQRFLAITLITGHSITFN